MWLHLSQYTMRRGSPPEIFYSPTYRCDWNRRTPRASFQYKDNLSMYRNSYYKDKTVVKLSPLIIPLLATRCLYIEMTPLSFTGNTSRNIDVIISSKWRIAYSANLLPNCILGCFDMRCHHFDEIFAIDCPGSYQNDNFQCCQWRKFHQNENIYVSVGETFITTFIGE